MGLSVWLSGNALVSSKLGALILEWVTACLWAVKPSRYATSHPGRVSRLPSVGRYTVTWVSALELR